MDGLPTKEGTIPFDIPSIDSPSFTYYKVVGELSGHGTPVIVLHGGPGAGHDYMLPFAALWSRYGMPVIFYDQIGCGLSTHFPSRAGDRAFWQESLFLAELDNLIDHFQLPDDRGFHLLGQSWGGMLAATFASRSPRGLKKLILASGLADMDLNIRGVQLLREQLPTSVQSDIKDAEKTGNFNAPAYKEAQQIFFTKHVCRKTDPVPEELLASMKKLSEAQDVYQTMYGPSFLSIDGSLLGWTTIPVLKSIDAPTLVYNGEYDSSHDIATAPFFEHIPRVRWITLPDSSHMCHLEGDILREKVLNLVGRFLVPENPAEM